MDRAVECTMEIENTTERTVLTLSPPYKLSLNFSISIVHSGQLNVQWRSRNLAIVYMAD